MVVVVVLGVLATALIIVQAFAITNIVVPVFQQSAGLAQVRTAVLVLFGAVIGRVLLSYLTEAMAFRASAAAKSQLRIAVMEHIVHLGPVWRSGRNSAQLTQLLTRGIDGLDGYFSRYLPQLVLAVIVPLSVGVVILIEDPLAALIVLCTVPLIPVFMILIGKYTQSKVDRQWRTLGQLSGHFVDVVAGMATLKAFGRGAAQAKNVELIGDRYRQTTMGVLRVSFLSSLVLEILAMIAVAMVAVAIGVRLVDGTMTLHAGLLVLILVPEVYLPLRLVGMHFHAAAEGLGAAGDMVEILETESVASGPLTEVPDLSLSTIRFSAVSVVYPSRTQLVVEELDLQIEPRTITALVGSSGAGKSTVVSVLERFLDPCAGQVTVDSDGKITELREFDVAAWRSQVAWVGQNPQLISGSIAANVALGSAEIDRVRVLSALDAVGMTSLVDELAAGIDTDIGEAGRTLSVGQSRRIALARAFYSSARLVLLDEPTAALDGQTEDDVLAAIDRLAQQATVVVVAHRPALIARADLVVTLPDPVSAADPDDSRTMQVGV